MVWVFSLESLCCSRITARHAEEEQVVDGQGGLGC